MEKFNFERQNNEQENKEDEKKSFDDQFAEIETIENFYGQNLEFVDIHPGKEQEDFKPVLVAPGWAENTEVLKDTLESLYNRDIRSLSLTHSNYKNNPSEQEETSVFKLKKAEALLAVIERTHIPKVNLIAHSEGAINGLLAAFIKPEKFESITLVGSGGLMEKDNIFKLMSRFSLGLGQDMVEAFSHPEKKEKINEIRKEVLRHIVQNPLKSTKEGQEIAQEDIRKILKVLKEKGIGIIFVHAVDDLVFPMTKVQNVLKKEMVDGFYSTKGGHYELVTNPQKYIDLILHGIEAFSKKKSKK